MSDEKRKATTIALVLVIVLAIAVVVWQVATHKSTSRGQVLEVSKSESTQQIEQGALSQQKGLPSPVEPRSEE